MAIQGLRDTNNFVTNQRPQNWREGVLLLKPNGTAPLFALSSVMKKKTTDDPQFNWWDKVMPSQRIQLATGTIAAADTAIAVVTGASQLKDGHLVYFEESGEIALVNGDPSSETSITLIRGYSGTTASAITTTGSGVNPYITVIGSAYEEGSDAPTGVNYDPTKRTNYTQIFRNTLEATRTAMKTRLRTGDAVKEAKRECLELHSMEVERAFWFGYPVETVRNGKPLRTTGGIVYWINQASSTRVTDLAGASTDLQTLEGYLKTAFDFGSSEKMGFAGNTAMLTLQQIVRKNASYQLMQGQREFGMNVTRLITPFGELVLKTHPLFNRMQGGTTSTAAYYGADSWLFILDMENIMYRPFQGDDTRYEAKLQSNGLDGMKSGFITECGLEVAHPLSHYLIKGLASAAVDT